ncbi:Transporter [Meloidogyne graminicola]|uniref:Transporter n=1 Tax=Meloidogyne graminicola TaxID=189291 RepID=A0A8S9ZLT5_9BILA|nr:Transporter [Meloidogyne graminicola]
MATIPGPPASTKSPKAIGSTIENDNNIVTSYNNRTGFLQLPTDQSSHRRLLAEDNHLKTNGRRRNRSSSSPSPDLNLEDDDEDEEEEGDEIGPMESKQPKINSSRVMFSNNNNNLSLHPNLLEEGENGITNGSSSDMMDISDDDGREGWDNKMQFFMGVISYAVGFGNVWRFPFY